MKILKLVRDTFLDNRILGTMEVDGHIFQTGERTWAGNKRNVSCIPCGIYDVCRYWSRRFGLCLMLLNVPGRNGILIHVMNYPDTQSRGCIGIGKSRKDIDGDGVQDLYQSRKALDELLEILSDDEVKIQIMEEGKNV